MSLLKLIFFVLLFSLYIVFSAAQIPDKTDCDHLNGLKCFCEQGCNRDGTCIKGTECKAGHTGLYCQYYFWNDAHPFINDESPSSCMGNRNELFDDDLDSCEIVRRPELLIDCESRRFLYLEITHTTSASSLRDISLDMDNRKCETLAVIEVDEHTSHVTCPHTELFQQLRLTYSGINLCEVRMVVGMDVASQQNTSQSNLNQSLAATSCLPVNDVYSFEDAVGTNQTSGQCSFASTSAPRLPYWRVIFSIPSVILSISTIVKFQNVNPDFVACSTEPGCRARQFLFFFIADNSITIKPASHLLLDPYRLEFWTESWQFRAIKILSHFKPLSLCRVNVFGDHSCSRGTYGPLCGLACSCNHGGCAVASGLCPVQEPQGVCPDISKSGVVGKYFWGPDCLRDCFCSSQCDRTTGKCETSCVDDAYGFPYCDKTCYCKDGCTAVPQVCTSGCTSEFRWGDFCNETCYHCVGGVCDANGSCITGHNEGSTNYAGHHGVWPLWSFGIFSFLTTIVLFVYLYRTNRKIWTSPTDVEGEGFEVDITGTETYWDY